MKFDTIKIRGISFDIFINNQGKFFTQIDGDDVKADSFDALKKKLMSSTGRKSISIPFVYWEDAGWNSESGHLVRGVCVGMHAGNDNLLVKLGNDQGTQQFSAYHHEQHFDPKHAEEITRLQEALTSANKAWEKFKEKHRFNLRDAVVKALGGKEPE